MPPKPIVYFPVAKHSIHNSPSPFIKNKFEERRARRLIVADRAVEAKRSRICLAVGSHLPKAFSCLRPSPIQRAAARKQSPLHGPPPRRSNARRSGLCPTLGRTGHSAAHPTFETEVAAALFLKQGLPAASDQRRRAQ